MYIFIVNPVAGNGRARRIFTKVSSSQLYKSIDSKCFFTDHKGHAEEITRDYTTQTHDQVKGIIVIGGDGTLNEVLNGLMNKKVLVGFIPGGSANDFARGCSIAKDPIKILEQMINQHPTIPYWLGMYEVDHNEKRYFVNSIGIGFDAEVAKTANQSSYKKIFNFFRLGKISYVIALIQVLFRFKPLTVEIEMNGYKQKIRNCWMVTITNHPYYGGGMKIIPKAKIQPNKFPILFIHSVTKLKVLSVFLTVFTGSHVKFKEVEIKETSKVKITTRSNNKLTYQVDGETSTCKTCLIGKHTNPIIVNGEADVRTSVKKVKESI